MDRVDHLNLRGRPTSGVSRDRTLVRPDSLMVERRNSNAGLFVVRGAYGRPRIFSEVSALKPIRELFSQRSGGKFGPKIAGDRSLSKGEKAKEDRQFESPPLQQRGSANRRSAFMPGSGSIAFIGN
jgi:hypothetical protein